jgi:hypothetical protein
VVEQRLGQNAAGRVVGAQEQDIKWSEHGLVQLGSE